MEFDLEVSMLPWRCSVIFPKGFVIIAAIAVTKHGGNLLRTKTEKTPYLFCRVEKDMAFVV